jgi:hypothetical protein
VSFSTLDSCIRLADTFSGACVPETYTPVRLRSLATALTKETGLLHRSAEAPVEASTLGRSLVRPFQMLVREGIVAFFAVYSGFICKSEYTSLVDVSLMLDTRWSALRILWGVPLVGPPQAGI